VVAAPAPEQLLLQPKARLLLAPARRAAA